MNQQSAHLCAGSTSFLCEVEDGALIIRHWGARILGDISQVSLATRPSVANSGFDAPVAAGIMRESARGFLGQQSLTGHGQAGAWSTKFQVTDFKSSDFTIDVSLQDQFAKLEVQVHFELDDFGVLTERATVTNLGDAQFFLNDYIHWLPLPQEATQTLDFVGRWSNERNPQRRNIATGTWVRDSREGRSGHNFSVAQIALTNETNFRSGQAWAVSVAWSGNSQYAVERIWDGTQSIGAGELLLPGEVVLAKAESYEAPALVGVYSSHGLDGVSNTFHSHIRARQSHPKRPRPLTLNMWEAVYFAHDEANIRKIVDVAAEIGVERVVLDDGWFHSRRDDLSGLGDWVIDPQVWPQGLGPIIEYINSKGIEFGLWFEGEMVNVDSDLYRAHPEWILQEGARIPPEWRHQQVLDLGHPGAFDHVLSQVDAILSAHNISYIKWDHNRTLVDAGHLGQAGVRRQTKAIYRLFTQLKLRHPQLEIESCASGGARVDLGVIDYVDRFWTSDNNDALARQTIQRWTMQVIPPELLGTHIGPTHGHQTGRTLELSFRAITALFGHAGIEWDITEADEKARKVLTTWATFYKANREFLHSAQMVRIDYPDNSAYLHGVQAPDRSRGLYAYVQLEPTIAVHPAPMKFPDFDPVASYIVKAVYPAGRPRYMLSQTPEWLTGVTLSGSALAQVGLSVPILAPANAFLIEITRI